MQWSRPLRAVLIGVVVLLASSRQAVGSCAVFEIAQGFRDARAVFIGQVLSTRVVRAKTTPFDVNTVAIVRVERQWKGPRAKTLEVSSCGGGDVVCTVSMEFVVGQRYLFFAEGRPLSTSDCMSQSFDAARSELRWLERKPSTRPG
jgi:hypothetical protein